MAPNCRIGSNRWSRPLEFFLKNQEPLKTTRFLDKLVDRLRESGVKIPHVVSTPYINTIPVEKQPAYPGDWQTEVRIKSFIRWNAMAMVVNANAIHDGLGGHISTFASSATLYEVAFNHFFRARHGDFSGDIVYFQGHASPGVYARAFLEGRLDERHLHNFRQELAEGGGLSSYPHPYLMPDFWQFPTVSMGLGPIMSIYQARFNRYLRARGIIKGEEPKVWCFIGDGETDEPETLGSLTLGSRENLDNLIWVINCNLQRLDGPVRGNGKIIQELEALFNGAGWNVIKVIWGSDWDELLARDKTGLLLKRMGEVVDGDYQKYSVEPGSYTRKHFFGKYPELLELVNHLTDEQIRKLLRGGHDTRKVYTAYKAAMEHKGSPTVILAKTIKGYGLGEAGEGKNITHQQKKLNEKELREFRTRFHIPLNDEEVVETPFYRPAADSQEIKYLLERRKKLGGFLPARVVTALRAGSAQAGLFCRIDQRRQPHDHDGAFGRLLATLLRHKAVGKQIVPIIPDEARTFGLDALFKDIGIYAPKGQLYEPVDKESLLYYNETKNGQILEEGITEAGSMSSFIAAGTAYATHGVNMIPFYIYYSMFGFQRIGDQMWLAGDIKAKGFLLGATYGRTTLNGEGLQHQDGHSLLDGKHHSHAIRLRSGVRITKSRRSLPMACIGCTKRARKCFIISRCTTKNMPCRRCRKVPAKEFSRGFTNSSRRRKRRKHHAHIFGSGPIINQALRAQTILAEKYGVAADVWSATNYKLLRTDALQARRWNMLHPTEQPRKSYLQTLLENEKGPFIAVSDNMKIVPDQIAPWVPGGLTTLGTDGFGRSDTRANLRRFFEVDAELTVIATLYALAEKGELEKKVVEQAIKDLNVAPEKAHAVLL